MTPPSPAARRGPAMSWAEWGRHDAVALADLVRGGEVTPGELARQAALAVAMLEPELEAVLSVFEDVVDDPHRDRPNPDGWLYGIPILLKDVGCGLAGRLQERGSALYRGAVATTTDPTVENLLQGGLIPLGRSTTPEFGLTLDTTTSYRGRVAVTRNPWDLRRTAGGSSGGAGAVVAAGIMPIAMSADGGGSTRIPAAFNGLVGLKATRGRVPQPLSRSEYSSRIYIEGVLTRSVRDTAAVYETLTRVPNGGSFMPVPAPSESYLAALRRPPPRLRVGLSAGSWGRAGAPESEIAARTREVGRLLEGLGHEVDEIDDTALCDWPVLWDAYLVNWLAGQARLPAAAQARGIAPADLERHVERMTFRHYLAARRYDKLDLFRMMDGNRVVTRSFGRMLERYDVLVAPTLPIRVPAANGAYSLLRDEELDPWIARLMDACRYTMPANETGLPSIALPAGSGADGLPIGVQIYGNFSAEPLLLQLAAEVEAARPAWFGAMPPIHVAREAAPRRE